MSRLYSLQMSAIDVAAHLGVTDPPTFSTSPQVVEGDHGLVMLEEDGRRVMRPMRWGFPRVAQGIDEPAVIGLVADLTNRMWEQIVVDALHRCVIPITHFGNPDGEPGRKTRTWFSVRDRPVMAWAGFWQELPGIGAVYAGMTMTANASVQPTNDRMPTLLKHDEVDAWLHCQIRDVIGFQFRKPIAAARMEVTVTADRWRSGSAPPGAAQPTLL